MSGKISVVHETAALGCPYPGDESIRTRTEHGKALRKVVPRSTYAAWKAGDPRDPLARLAASNVDRLSALIPLRYGRLAKHPYAFLRGSLAVAAEDFSRVPVTGLLTQICGDAHLGNFGLVGTPERNLIFTINDFDETCCGPWEWDVLRLATSAHVAGRVGGLTEAQCGDAVLACVEHYRRKLRAFAELPALALWYARLDVETMAIEIPSAEARALQERVTEQARSNTLARLLPKITKEDGEYLRFIEQPNSIYRVDPNGPSQEVLRAALHAYRDSLPAERRRLLDRFRLTDVAGKISGVGSVGLYNWLLLLEGENEDWLVLQFKQAGAPQAERYGYPSGCHHHGARVVYGQRLMQAFSDLCLGWSVDADGRYYYVRQLRDISYDYAVEKFSPAQLRCYAQACAWTLACAHARAGDAAAIGGYLGKSDAFDEAVVEFARRYAEVVEADHAALCKAITDGGIPAERE